MQFPGEYFRGLGCGRRGAGKAGWEGFLLSHPSKAWMGHPRNVRMAASQKALQEIFGKIMTLETGLFEGMCR